MNSNYVKIFKDKTHIFFDGDGTLYLSDHCLPKAKSLLTHLRQEGKKVFLYTNNSSKTPADLYKRSQNLELNFKKENILFSTQSCFEYLKEKNHKTIYLLSNKKVRNWFKKERFIHTETNPSCVVITYDTELTYKKLITACKLIQTGTPYIATHPDRTCPSKEGALPDIGMFIDMIQESTKISPEVILGKPNIKILESLLKKHQIPPQHCLIVGDRLYTDIAWGNSLVDTLLVLTGETTKEHLTNQIQTRPTHIIDSFESLF